MNQLGIPKMRQRSTLLRTYEEVNLGKDAVYEEVGDHVNPPGNRPQTGKPNQQTRKARKCNAHYRGSRAPMHPRDRWKMLLDILVFALTNEEVEQV